MGRIGVTGEAYGAMGGIIAEIRGRGARKVRMPSFRKRPYGRRVAPARPGPRAEKFKSIAMGSIATKPELWERLRAEALRRRDKVSIFSAPLRLCAR